MSTNLLTVAESIGTVSSTSSVATQLAPMLQQPNPREECDVFAVVPLVFVLVIVFVNIR